MRTTKTNHTFRLTKRNKTLLALGKFENEEKRNEYKHMLIDSQVAASIVVKSTKDRSTPIKGE